MWMVPYQTFNASRGHITQVQSCRLQDHTFGLFCSCYKKQKNTPAMLSYTYGGGSTMAAAAPPVPLALRA